MPLPRLTYPLTAGTFLMGTTEFVIAGLLPDLARTFGVPVGHAGLAITAFAIGMVIGPPVITLATLRVSRRTVLVSALLVFALGQVLAATTPWFGVFLAARFVTALGTGAFWAVASVVAARAAGPSSAARALGIVMGGGNIATVLGVPLGAVAGFLVGWQVVFWALAAAAVLLVVPVWWSVEPTAETAQVSLRAELRGLRSAQLWLVLGTAIGTGIAATSLSGPLGPLGPVSVGIAAGALMLLPLMVLALRTRTHTTTRTHLSATEEPVQ